MKTTAINRKDITQKPVLEKYQFVPYFCEQVRQLVITFRAVERKFVPVGGGGGIEYVFFIEPFWEITILCSKALKKRSDNVEKKIE